MFSLPSWLLVALKSRRKWKTFIRCTLVLVATLVLLVDDATLQSMGQAGFFAAILAIMLPPSMPLTLFILANMTLVIGMLLGWACGAAAMAAALKARSQTLLIAQLQSAQALLDPNMPAALQFERLMFNGHFLDTRSSVVYGAFIFVGSFFLAAIRGLSPSLSLLSIFALIVLDVMCSYGPLFYSAQYTIAKQFLIPTGYYLAIAIASLVLVFPETLNHVWLSLLLLADSVFAPIKETLDLLSQALSSRPSDRATWESFTHTGTNLRQVVTEGAQGLLGQTALLDVEFSLGKLGPGDLKKVSGEVKSLIFQTNGLLSFLTFVQEGNKMDEKEEADLGRSASSQKDKRDGMATPDRLTWLRREIREHETRHGHSLDSLVPILESVSEIKVFQEGRVKLIEPYKQFFDVETGKLKETTKHLPTTEKFTSRSLFLCFVFCDTLLVFSDRLSRVMRLVVDLDQKRSKVRMWAPSGFGKIGRKLMRSKGDDVKGVVPLAMGSAADPSEYVDSENSTMRDGDGDEEATRSKHEESHRGVDHHRRNPDALPPRTGMGRFAVRLGAFLRWFKSAEGVFALRTAIVTLALWIPAVVPSSAGFNYEHKGLWALVMAQMSLAVYAGEQIAGIALRTVGTVLGLLLGMAVWYIGAGSGLGNPYGVVISTTVFVAPFLYIRVVGPMQDAMLWILAGVTIIFVVGYSWIDSHLEMLTSSGVGVEVGWRRALLVIIGFVAAFVVMLFPQPTSARTLVRKTVASSLEQLGRVFASEVDAILAEEAKGRKGIVERPDMGDQLEGVEVSPKEKRVRILAERMLTIATRLQTLTPSLDTGKWEPQLQGSWPQHHYQALHTLETRLLSCLGLLAGSFVRLDTNWCYILVHKTPFLNPHLLADIFSTISVLSHALSAGYPSSFLKPQKCSEKKGLLDNGYSSTTELDPSPNKVDGVTIGFEELTLDVLIDDQLPAHSTAVLAISSILAIIDEIADIIRILCGETSFEGIGALHQEYLNGEEAMLYHA
ncbi:hypothetical protein PC9H_004273 [Pleurotus ostreatus]|uniref:ER transporter 6TM N-terminal domain-containing protein n=1 Tax=Pleurotus ostreatus TaxID=5322 RepID=A0A8H7DUN8_PLEOS|nr:uncharacterized protein PC9H_004273 [Pleurotus ostreatus]KAF7437434.1 hypothetical protein PC9H_004273 [Pleurotus ostreatus]